MSLEDRAIAKFAGRNARKKHERQPGEDEFEDVSNASTIMTTTMQPVKMCVEQRVPCGLVIIGGRPKSRKSWYALQLGIAKATGGRFMGVDTPAGRVLYVALEDNDRRMRQRLEFFGVRPENAPTKLHIVYEWPTGLEGAEKLQRWLEQYPDTVLIIIDVLQRFRGARDPRQSLYEGDYETMALLHGLTKRHAGLTVLVVHHVRKGAVDDPVEAINGTFAIAGAADAYIILRRGADKDEWIAHIDGRDWESWDHDHVWKFLPVEGWRQIGVSDGVELTEVQREIIRAAKDAGYITPTRLADLRGIGKSTAHESLHALVQKGAMRVYAGKYYPIAE
ncbi:AAA family ATPase [Microbacterium sp.]|uniref:AAA family ATPase n=1 Tax=Microbacterium sp. TaxID=51671 RepID=UPI002732B5FA|nr:AAA family ATPase [Microbacterium sp.]MDP3949600.1 AAA family ATPase [Microbacterium sp.]